MRKSFVGDEAQKWAYPQLWAWAGKRGPAHFARPSPHVLGVRTHARIVGQPVLCGHAIRGCPHMPTRSHEKLATFGCASASTHPCKIGRQRSSTPQREVGCPSISTQLHVLPRNFGRPYKPTFSHEVFERPHIQMCLHELFGHPHDRMCAHEVLGRPHTYVESHAPLWASA